MVNHIIAAHRRTSRMEAVVAKKRKFTRIPKLEVFLEAQVPSYCWRTYVAFADHANNKTGLCWPSQQRLADLLGLSVRQIRRHIKILIEAGLIEIVKRHRHKGRFSTCLYRVFFFLTSGHERPPKTSASNIRRTRLGNSPLNPPKEAFNAMYGKERNLQAEAEYERQKKEQREMEAKKRWEGYEYLLR